MARTKTNRRRHQGPGRAVQAPKKRPAQRGTPSWAYGLGAALLVAAIASGAFLFARDNAQSGGEGPAISTGLPSTPDYHSLLVAPSNPANILLGTHAGLYDSRDSGRTWRKVALAGQDAMNLARARGQTLWTAGHMVFAKSTDGGESWSDVRPKGLPSLDLHGFAVDPAHPDRLYAAVAGQGLYRSDDNGGSFRLVSTQVGGAVMALAVTSDGRILAGDMEQGLMESTNGGKDWRLVLRAALMGLAVNPDDPKLVLATGPGILRSADRGKTFTQVLALEQGAGPVAWSSSNPKRAYAVGFDRRLYRSNDGGLSWAPVA